MTVLGLIPARGGSKRLPGKNMRPLNGHPLLLWTIMCATHADELDHLVISSEDEDILRYAEEWDVDTIARPPEFATDEADSYCVMLHALDQYEDSFDYLCLLQPTSPLRTPVDIDTCIACLRNIQAPASEHHFPAVVSVQEGEEVPNGAVYVGRTDWLRDGGNFDEPWLPRYYMPKDRSVDIDTEADFAWAERLVKEHGHEVMT